MQICRRIRETSQLPIIMLTARGDDFDVVVGLEAGADDYIVKPARTEVIEARIRAVLRRLAEPAGRTVARAFALPVEGDSSGPGHVWRGSDKAVAMLFGGPTQAEAEAGLRTELPHIRAVLRLALWPDGVSVRVNTAVTELSEVARQQLICTAAQARTTDRRAAVKVTGTDGVIGPAHSV